MRSPLNNGERRLLLETVRQLYAVHGIVALSTPFLEKQKSSLYAKLLAVGLKQPFLLAEFDLAEEYAAWRESNRSYRGSVKPKWSWDAAVSKAKEIVERDGELPNVQECRETGLSSLTNAVHNSGKTWEELRAAVGLRADSFAESRNGMRWRSRPEACLSNFLHARGVQHRKGGRYPKDYTEQTRRRWGQYDLHFCSAKGEWINVEVWGDPLNGLSGGRYKRTRTLKEKWHRNDRNFLGISYQSCFSDIKLTEILKPYIGQIVPFRFERIGDDLVQTSHWSNKDELIQECRRLAEQMPNGVFPPESWLRKRGKYANRQGESYNTLAIRVNQWLGGTRNVRRILGQSEVSTAEWTKDNIAVAWHEFHANYGITPSQSIGATYRKLLPRLVLAKGSRIYQAARYHGALSIIRNEGTARKTKWTPGFTRAEWRRFFEKHHRTPSECMSALRRKTMPRDITDEATRIYAAARRLGLLPELRGQQDK
jgi:hypothetical protein